MAAVSQEASRAQGPLFAWQLRIEFAEGDCRMITKVTKKDVNSAGEATIAEMRTKRREADDKNQPAHELRHISKKRKQADEADMTGQTKNRLAEGNPVHSCHSGDVPF